MRTRVYETTKLPNGKRIVQSQSLEEYIEVGIVKWIFKVIFFCFFFWIIIPVKLLKKIMKR